MLGRLLSGFITILIGTTLIPTVATAARGAVLNSSGDGPSNVTGASSTVTGLVTLFFVIGVMTAGVAVAVGGLRDAGLM